MTQYQEKIVGKPGGLVEPGVKQYGIFKKIKKGLKKVVKSPLGKIGLGALLEDCLVLKVPGEEVLVCYVIEEC